MTGSSLFATKLARGWVSLYTAGLPPRERLCRRQEIESDLWELRVFESADGSSDPAISLHIIWRLVCGLPADLTWRLEQVPLVGRSELVLEGSGNMIMAMKTNGWTGLALLMTLVAAGVWSVLAGYSAAGEHISSTAEDVAFLAAILAGVALIVAAGYSLARSGRLTATILALGGVAVLALTYWFSPTTW